MKPDIPFSGMFYTVSSIVRKENGMEAVFPGSQVLAGQVIVSAEFHLTFSTDDRELTDL